MNMLGQVRHQTVKALNTASPSSLVQQQQRLFATSFTRAQATTTTSQVPILKPSAAARSIPPALPNKTIKSILTTTKPDTVVKVQGWIRSTRHQKHVTFVEVNDGSSLKGVQAILNGGQGKG
jgi:asparaginyl-tRNA synthetase